MEDQVLVERVVTIFGMLFWFAFPIGMMISVIQQDDDSHHGFSKDVEEGFESAHEPEIKKSA